jgi:hypothetical protein
MNSSKLYITVNKRNVCCECCENDRYYIDVDTAREALRTLDGRSLTKADFINEVLIVMKAEPFRARGLTVREVSETITRLLCTPLLCIKKGKCMIKKNMYSDALAIINERLGVEFQNEYLRELYRNEVTINETFMAKAPHVISSLITIASVIIGAFFTSLSAALSKENMEIISIGANFAFFTCMPFAALITVYGLAGVEFRKPKVLSMQDYINMEHSQLVQGFRNNKKRSRKCYRKRPQLRVVLLRLLQH